MSAGTLLRRWYLVLGLAGVAAVALAGGVAYANIPDQDGIITACYKKAPPNQGPLRVIDTEKGQKCTSAETELQWNQVGQPGEQGEPGISLFANVREDGTLTNGSGVTGVQLLAGPNYRVTFDRDVSACAGVASSGNNPGQGGFVQTAPAAVMMGSSGQVTVAFVIGGNPLPTNFHLVVAC